MSIFAILERGANSGHEKGMMYDIVDSPEICLCQSYIESLNPRQSFGTCSCLLVDTSMHIGK